MQVSDEHLRGRTVVAADGVVVGEVAALFIDTSTWSIDSVQIKLNKPVAEKLGVAGGLLRAATLVLPVGKIKSVGDAVLLAIPTQELHEEKS